MPTTFDYKKLAFKSRMNTIEQVSVFPVNKFGMNLATAAGMISGTAQTHIPDGLLRLRLLRLFLAMQTMLLG